MRTNVLLLGAVVFAGVLAAQAQPKKYDIKSGVVTYESIMNMGGFEIKKKEVVSFDDFGMRECKETFSRDKLEETFFSDGKNLYLMKPGKKTAYKRGTATRGTELRVEWSEFGTEKERQSGMYKKLPAMKVAGKDCEVFEYNDGKGTITRYGGWNKILLYMEMKSKSMESTQRALKVEEHAAVPADKFKVPAGFPVQ